MKILFQGGWRTGRDPAETKELITVYCEAFARQLVLNDHQVILTGNREFDRVIADVVTKTARETGRAIKDHLLFLLADRRKEIPKEGVVKRIDRTKWWIEERTYAVQSADVVVAIGGGKGTFDCVEKAFLANRPVFVVSKIECKASDAWRRRKSSYNVLTNIDAEFVDDLSIEPEEFFEKAFKVISSLERARYTRKVFLVHGRDEHFRDTLVALLKSLDFVPIVLQDEPGKSLTIIEKLERDTSEIGFCFVLYTPDDLGGLSVDELRSRARQNVIFEHGMVIGLLGRKRTCAIIKGDVEIPSDILGMVYESVQDIKRDSLKIARVLKDAGYSVDLDRLF